MLSFLYTIKGYRFLKAGLLCDLIFKRFVFYGLQQIFQYFIIFFSEKFIIEELFLKIRKVTLYVIFFHHSLYRANFLKLFCLLICSVLLISFIFMF